MTRVTGGCHCGAVGFEVMGEFSSGMECNCSHCDIKGLLLAFVPRPDFVLTRGEDETAIYHFNRGAIDHVFCKTCGVEAFGFGAAPDGTRWPRSTCAASTGSTAARSPSKKSTARNSEYGETHPCADYLSLAPGS